jgi:hypothetical protein
MSEQVVFIDSRVPDMQDLLDNLNPGEQAFVIDGNSDGLEDCARKRRNSWPGISRVMWSTKRKRAIG